METRNTMFWKKKCTVVHSNRVNKVNGFHSFIKERLLVARGVATIYLKRYNVLFSQTICKHNTVTSKMFELMTTRGNSFSTIESIKSKNLLNI